MSFLSYFCQDIQKYNYPNLIQDLVEVSKFRNLRNNSNLLQLIVKTKHQLEAKDVPDNFRSFTRLIQYLT